MRDRSLEIVGLFPSSNGFGGVQLSGRDAWEGILRRVGRQNASILHYEASKTRTILQAITTRRSARVLLVWHMHLLKLLPFLDTSISRVVLFLHGIEAWLKQDSLTQVVLRKVHLILSNSDHTWDRFVAWNPEFRDVPHRTVHLGAGSCFGAATPRPSQAPIVLMVGRLNKSENYKGHQQMMEAWPLVLQRIPEARLWIVGDGDLRSSLERMAGEHALNHAVRFFGQVSDAEKERLIAQVRCLALPSRGEGFGLVYLEAMRLGRPCLVSNLDAGREVVNPPEAGLAVDPGDPAEIADVVQRLLSPGAEWEQWSARARSRYEWRFTAEQFQQRLVSALFET
jgi:phosphatidylinositol alpha-1,6-mannosyltransferase